MTEKAIQIVAVSGDSGGAEAIAPVLAALEAKSTGVHAYAYRQAQAVWTERGLVYEALSEKTDDVECKRILRRHQPDLVLTSTSVNGINLERKFTAAASSSGIPSLAVLDMWTNYRRRFSNGHGDLAFLTDRIAVMDKRAKAEMIAEGIDEDRLVVTGQPAFESIASWRGSVPRGFRQIVRSALDIREADVFVVFGSQPISTIIGIDTAAPGHIGYTERTVLPLLVEALENIANDSPNRISLVIRPHPRETAESFAWLQSSRIRILMSSQFHRREIALAADLVVGMNSAFLIEASCLGCRAVSLQPGLRQPDTLPAGGFGVIRTVYDAAEIPSVLEQLLTEKAPGQESCPEVPRLQPATENIIALMFGMIRRQS